MGGSVRSSSELLKNVKSEEPEISLEVQNSPTFTEKFRKIIQNKIQNDNNNDEKGLRSIPNEEAENIIITDEKIYDYDLFAEDEQQDDQQPDETFEEYNYIYDYDDGEGV